jgi:hypothetical protein
VRRLGAAARGKSSADFCWRAACTAMSGAPPNSALVVVLQARLKWQYRGTVTIYHTFLHSLYQSACITLLRS